MLGVEAAIILIAFVIVAAAFSFMVVNMGLFATQRGRDTITQGIQEASTPLILDGTIIVNGSGTNVTDIVIPLKTLGVKYVPMANETTVVSLRVGNHTAYPNIYEGIDVTTSPKDNNFEDLIGLLGEETTAVLFVENSDGDDSLSAKEKGLLIIHLSNSEAAGKRETVFIEIRPEKGAPLTIEFVVPSELQKGFITIGG